MMAAHRANPGPPPRALSGVNTAAACSAHSGSLEEVQNRSSAAATKGTSLAVRKARRETLGATL